MITNKTRGVQSVRSSNLIGEFDNKEIREYNLGEKLLYILVEKGWEELCVVPVLMEWKISTIDKSLVEKDLINEAQDYFYNLNDTGDSISEDLKVLYKITHNLLQSRKYSKEVSTFVFKLYETDPHLFIQEFRDGTLAEMYNRGVPVKVLLRRYSLKAKERI